MGTVIVQKKGFRNWVCRIGNMVQISRIPRACEALTLGKDFDMSMLDNPLIGDYTKGISRGRVYFDQLERRFRAEKAPLIQLSEDLQTSFQIVKGHGRLAGKKCLPKKETPVDKLPKGKKKQWKSVSLQQLGTALKLAA